ncbi:MAG TPA: thiolase domain-containing protein [Candidatus Woesebacteria bacterium]|nr:thiolase domain-containing protein [Candidatus Woesebacteria bacterium]
MNTIIGYYSTKFGELWNLNLDDLIKEAMDGILAKTHIEKEQIDAIFFGNMLGGIVEENLLLSAHIAEQLGVHIPIYRVEGACASGGLAFQMANDYLKVHPNATVVVLGAEKMTDIGAEEVTKALASAAGEDEQSVGLTFPGVYALIAQLYLKKYNYTEEHLATVTVKNHAHGVLNENAHFRRLVTVDNVLESPYVAFPLKVLDSSPISDGAAALVLTNNTELIKKSKVAHILSSEVATDSVSIAKREKLDELKATKIAGEKAFKTAGITREDIHVMEVHDCFSIAELLAIEDLGFWKKGEGGARAKEMSTQLHSGSNLIVNTSGGLKAAGHPVGGTGIKQLGEIYLQLTEQAGERQVKNVNYGLAHNVGGSGGVAVVSILGS